MYILIFKENNQIKDGVKYLKNAKWPKLNKIILSIN